MFKVPVTFYFDFGSIGETARPYIMAEFARYGAKHLVLAEPFITRIINTPGFEDTLLQEMSDNDLSFCDAHAPFGTLLDLNCTETPKRAMMIARHKLILEICQYMKVDTITIHLGNNRGPELSEEKHVGLMKESLNELLPLAEKLGITICIENIWLPVNTPDILNSIKAEFPTEALGFCYDSGHANIMSNGVKYATGTAWNAWTRVGYTVPRWEHKALEKMLPHVVNCHLHDNVGFNDAHILPGRGNIDWPHIIGLLKKAPRLKVVQSEVTPVRTGTFIRELVEKFDELAELG